MQKRRREALRGVQRQSQREHRRGLRLGRADRGRIDVEEIFLAEKLPDLMKVALSVYERENKVEQVARVEPRGMGWKG